MTNDHIELHIRYAHPHFHCGVRAATDISEELYIIADKRKFARQRCFVFEDEFQLALQDLFTGVPFETIQNRDYARAIA